MPHLRRSLPARGCRAHSAMARPGIRPWPWRRV